MRQLLPALLLIGCSTSVVLDKGGEVGETGKPTTDDDPGETGTTNHTGDTSEPGETGDSAPEPVAIVDLTARVHDQMKSIIVLSWTQSASADVHAEYSFDDGDWLESPTYAFSAGAHQILLLGIPFETPVTWRLVVNTTPAADDASITTGTLPRGVPEADHISGDSSQWDTETRWVLASIAPSGGSSRPWTFIFDRQGRVVWANETPTGRTTFAPRPSADGSEILIDYNSWWGSFDGGVNSQVAALDIEGNELERWDTPGLIHPFTQLDDGRIAWSAAQGGSSYSGEALAVLNDDGDAVTLFNCNSFSRSHGGDTCGANALWWNPENGHFLYSLYTLDTIIEVDADGSPVRWFGDLSGSWGFSDPNTQFWWQHGGHLLSNGHLLLSTRRTETAEETLVREYELDETNEELTQVWTFGEGEGVYAEILGEARRLSNGNTIHNYGSATRVREVTEDGDVVWDLRWSSGGTLGCTWPLSDLSALHEEGHAQGHHSASLT